MSHSRLQLSFWCAATACFVLALVPAEHRSSPQFVDYRHMAAFAVLAALAALAWPRSLLHAAVGLAGFGAAIEIVQLIPALNRGASSGDLLSDLVGIAAGLAMARYVPDADRRRRSAS